MRANLWTDLLVGAAFIVILLLLIHRRGVKDVGLAALGLVVSCFMDAFSALRQWLRRKPAWCWFAEQFERICMILLIAFLRAIGQYDKKDLP